MYELSIVRRVICLAREYLWQTCKCVGKTLEFLFPTFLLWDNMRHVECRSSGPGYLKGWKLLIAPKIVELIFILPISLSSSAMQLYGHPVSSVEPTSVLGCKVSAKHYRHGQPLVLVLFFKASPSRARVWRSRHLFLRPRLFSPLFYMWESCLSEIHFVFRYEISSRTS